LEKRQRKEKTERNIPLTHRAKLLVKPAVYGVHFRLDKMASGIMGGRFSLISTEI
jgi:hypothetical protein